MKTIISSSFILIMTILFSVQAYAGLTLLGQGTSADGTYNLIYDTDLDITWFDYTTDADTWANQDAWAQSLSITFGSNTYTNWRLPATPVPDNNCSYIQAQSVGYDCTGSEMGYLWYTDLGNTSGVPLSYTSYFQNLLPLIYWSADGNNSNRYVFEFGNNYQGAGYQSVFTATYTNGRAIAVMDGMAAAPEPVSSILFLTGGATLGLRRLRNKLRK